MLNGAANTISTHLLPCGMPVIIEPMQGVRSVALCWQFPAGFAADPPEIEGVTTLLEEMLLRGAGKLDSREHADAADRLGASRGTSLSVFTMQITSTMLSDKLRETLPLLVDMALRPRLDGASLGPSKELALQAIESLKDDPQERAALLSRARHHPFPINRSGMGTPQTIASCSRSDVARTWETYARPKGSVLAIAGAVQPESVIPQLSDLLSSWRGEAPPIRVEGEAPRGYAHEHDQTNQVQIIVQYDAPSEADPRSVLERLAIGVLSGGMSGRLFSEVREKRGLCYAVSAGYRGDKEFGTVAAYVGTTPERAQESLQVLLEQLRHITTPAGRVTQEEFDRAKAGFRSGLVMSGESTAARAGALVTDWRRLGRPRSLGEVSDEAQRVTLDQLNDYLSRRTLGRLTIQTLGPSPLHAQV